MSAEPEPQKRPRGTVVELIRLVLVALFTAGGWQVARAVDAEGTRLLLFVVLGSLVGYVIGGIVGRSTIHAVSAVERDFQRIPASELLAGVIGLILGLVIPVLASFLLFRLPPGVAYPVATILAIVLAYLGYRVGRSKREELFGVFGLRTRALGTPAGEANVLDTSALIDARILDVVRAGFVGGTLLLPRGSSRSSRPSRTSVSLPGVGGAAVAWSACERSSARPRSTWSSSMTSSERPETSTPVWSVWPGIAGPPWSPTTLRWPGWPRPSTSRPAR